MNSQLFYNTVIQSCMYSFVNEYFLFYFSFLEQAFVCVLLTTYLWSLLFSKLCFCPKITAYIHHSICFVTWRLFAAPVTSIEVRTRCVLTGDKEGKICVWKPMWQDSWWLSWWKSHFKRNQNCKIKRCSLLKIVPLLICYK